MNLNQMRFFDLFSDLEKVSTEVFQGAFLICTFMKYLMRTKIKDK